MYRLVSMGYLPSTDAKHHNRVGRLMTKLREIGIVPFSYIVDNVRTTQKPSSWAGLDDFVDTVKEAYRKDFWASLDDYVHIFCEKDAIAGTIAPVTNSYDVPLSPIRGYVSLSYAHEIAEQWREIAKNKTIHAYYIGDFDPSGFDLERDLIDKLKRYSGVPEFYWGRLGVNKEDFAKFDLIPLAVKKSDKRYLKFVEEHGSECAEIDAIPPESLRSRVKWAIERHIPADRWNKLIAVENEERRIFVEALAVLVGRRERLNTTEHLTNKT